MSYSFFAMLFLVATMIAPPNAQVVTLQNTAHPEQSIEWTRGADGRWAMHLNGRDVGHFRREGGDVIHETGVRDPDRFAEGTLVDPASLRADARELRLRGSFARTTLRVERSGGTVQLVDAARDLLPIPLRLLAR